MSHCTRHVCSRFPLRYMRRNHSSAYFRKPIYSEHAATNNSILESLLLCPCYIFYRRVPAISHNLWPDMCGYYWYKQFLAADGKDRENLSKMGVWSIPSEPIYIWRENRTWLRMRCHEDYQVNQYQYDYCRWNSYHFYRLWDLCIHLFQSPSLFFIVYHCRNCRCIFPE